MITMKSPEMNQFIFGARLAQSIGQLINRLNAAEQLEEWEVHFCRIYESAVWEMFYDFEKTKEIDSQKLTPELMEELGKMNDLCMKLIASHILFLRMKYEHAELLYLIESMVVHSNVFVERHVSDVIQKGSRHSF